MYVPTRLRVLRIKYKITLKALAGRMNISNQHLSRMELADIPPTEYHEPSALSRYGAAAGGMGRCAGGAEARIRNL